MDWLSKNYVEYKDGFYRMATKAIHTLGDISRDKPDLCRINGEDGVDYIGSWVEGFGFFHVKFPKETTRKLTEEEKQKYCKGRMECNGLSYQYTIEDFKD